MDGFVKKQWCIDRPVLMFQLEQRYIVLQHGNMVRLLPSALPPRLTNEARGANRAAHERWDRKICLSRTHSHVYLMHTSLCRKKKGGGEGKESSFPAPFTGYFSDKEIRLKHQMKFFKSPGDGWKDKKGDGFCQVFLCWDGLK